MTDARRLDDQLVPNGGGTAVTIREMVLQHDSDIDDLKAWRGRTQVYERLMKWMLAAAAGGLIVGLVNLLITLSTRGL